MIKIERTKSIAVLALDREVINAVNPEMVARLADAFRSLAADDEIDGLVLTSSNEKFFCIGLDVPFLLTLDRPGFTEFWKAFNQMCLQLYRLPKPTVAAISGHATGAGCVILLCCDYRFIAEGRRLVGLPEIDLGVPVPFVSDCILRELVGLRTARDLADTGEFHDPERLQAMGVVDGILAPADLRRECVSWARRLGKTPRGSFLMHKRNRAFPIEAQIAAGLAEREEYFIDCWFSEEAQERLTAAAKKFVR